ncbi:peptidyl-prolyl cis-trans isomerase, partial [bacterium]|nr:peptidyl-prolyl cis-trans isomerase [bacterium]
SPLEEAAFALQPNTYSDIIKGENYHIVYCHRRIPEVTPSFEDVKEQVMIELREARIDPFFFKELDELLTRELPRFQIEASLFKPEQ